MSISVETCWQSQGNFKIHDVLKRVNSILWHAVTVIASCREAQVRRRIQLYCDDRVIDEFKEAGKRIANEDVNNLCSS